MSARSKNSDILYMHEYIKKVLYFAIVKPGTEMKSLPNTHYFSIDKVLVYEPYYSDFGPLNLGCVYRYCMMLNEKLEMYNNKTKIVHYTSMDAKKKANAAFLLGCYGVLYLGRSPVDALKPLMTQNQSYRPFQDATKGNSEYTITILDCLYALKKAQELGFFSFEDFDFEDYDKLDKIQGGDLNWIVPDKLLAFIGPVDYNVSLYHPPDIYIDYFQENNVKVVIRLNKIMYDANVFLSKRIYHYDLFFPDGSCPPRNILLRFLQISEETRGAIAVHCKAGLGRTGSLIGSYLIKHYNMTAREAIGWMRICRPGSVIGHQQRWLEDVEKWLLGQGSLYRKRMYKDENRFPIHKYGVYSIAQKAAKYRRHIEKSPSPPPPMQRHPSFNIPQIDRPKASKDRAAPTKTASKHQQQQECRPKSPNINLNRKHPSNEFTTYSSDRNSRSAISRRGSGAGEPRPVSPASQESSSRSPMIPNKTNVRNKTTTQIKTMNDAKSYILNSIKYEDTTNTNLASTLTVKPMPHYSYRVSNQTNNLITPSNLAHIPLSYNAASRNIPSASSRRRLGRSPSPMQTRPAESSKATNAPSVTAISSNKQIHKKTSKLALKEVLAGLIVALPRDVSAGAASLDARRTAPAPLRAPSVRSDERPLATQGDLLNSIKFQRRFRDMTTDKFTPAPKENISVHTTVQEKQSVKNVSSKTSGRIKVNRGDTVVRKPSPTRPLSPKGRRLFTFY